MAALKDFPQSQAIPERETVAYGVDLLDVDGLPLVASQVDEIYLSLRDLRNNAILNSREDVPAKNANGGTVTDGRFEFQFTSDDTAIIEGTGLQRRSLTLDVRLAGGGRATREIRFWVRAMQDISDTGSPV